MADALDELVAAMQRLLEAQHQEPSPRREGEGNFRCVRCTGCNDCRFCVDCRDCDECTYCESCSSCTGCTQSRGCRECQRTSHSFASQACDDCSYVTLCVDCEQCVHCFGCVGLAGAEFCILNEQHSRKDYQAQIGELRALLERRMSSGWQPPWMKDGEPERDALLDELAGFDDIDGIVAPLPRDPLEQAKRLEVALPPAEPVRDSPPEAAMVAPSRSVVRVGRPARPEPPSGERGASGDVRSRVLVARRPVR